MGQLEHAIVGLVDHYGYAGLFVALILGNIGAPVGSEIVLPVSGALTAGRHLSSLWLTIAVALTGELAGGSVGYAIGKYGGVPFVERFGKYVHITHERLMLFHRFFERWGAFAVFVCRFLPVIRGVVAIPAGVAEMNLGLFYLWTFAGSGIFCTALILLGYSLGTHLDSVLPLLRRGALIVLAFAIVAVLAAAGLMRARAKRAAAG
jgi:membrane protein DedA with SNARE-associated domain